MSVETPRRSSATRTARSTRWRACAGSMQTWTNSETSLNRAHLDELRVALGTVEGAEEAVDAVARVAEDAVHAPRLQSLQHEVGDRRHGGSALTRSGRSEEHTSEL